MEDALKARLPKRLHPHVTFDAVFWAGRVRERQRHYLDAVKKKALFSDSAYRSLVVQGLGDAAAYQKTKSFRNSSYYEIQAEVRTVIERLDQSGPPNRPLILIGHSLGCHIISSLAWDMYTIKHWDDARLAAEDDEVRKFAAYLKEGSAFRRLDTLAGLVMMGSNMPLFTFTFGPDRILPITSTRKPGDKAAFPGHALEPRTQSKVRWLNYYSRNDLLGYPLKPLNEAYTAEPLLTDIEVASEGWLRRLASYIAPPLAAYQAHTGYWTHRRVVRGAADLIAAIATADEDPRKRRFPFLSPAGS